MPAGSTVKQRSLGIIFTHGGFHLPAYFDLAKARLEKAGFSPVVTIRHPSIRTDPKITVDDNARNIQAELAPYLEQGKEFLTLAHSYSGSPLTIAAKGYSVKERVARGLKGGIRAIVFVTANIPPKAGASALSVLPPGLDIVNITDGLVIANAKAKVAFYGPNMGNKLADEYIATLLPQSQEALLGPVSISSEELTVPIYYILYEKDQTISPATQQQIISTIPTLKRVLRNPGRHSAFITEVEMFIEQINEIADKVEKDL
ncbi:hypothetical protein CCUS01_10341 [Colletotrichum cuscutae]|uniref:AB hydrolase-1 domain-containing protein n=1 Tax=Colletotrichum cuscutae TaxID=1209917 RepID=A0AAI9XQ29_9PEZI|nr:hypothetical protein CCUS01_10341 [Colletotrichum cuscutae]